MKKHLKSSKQKAEGREWRIDRRKFATIHIPLSTFQTMKIFDKAKKSEEKAEVENRTNEKDFKKTRLSKDKVGKIIIEPFFTEKASNLMQLNKYVFKVSKKANKNEVRKAVEGLYDVNVVRVNIVKNSAKPRRMGRREIIKPGFKKAVVTIKQGQSIELTKS